MKIGSIFASLAGVALVATAIGVTLGEVRAAEQRLKTGAAEAQKAKVAVANDAELPYCTPAFKGVLQRVLNACGLIGGESRRGCQPADVKQFASISDEDFNALFTPLKDRGAVIMFDDNSEKLDDEARKMLSDLWIERKGARYFFIVARASKTGTAEHNRELSHKRANSVKFHLEDTFKDPEFDKQVGLLWLGEEFAQLGEEYCTWKTSRGSGKCKAEDINRSAFVSWVDCQL